MHQNQAGAPNHWKPWRRTTSRALFLGALAAIAGGLIGMGCGAVLCLADGSPYTFALWCGFRCLLGGLAAGTIMGAVSGIYHVEEAAAAARKPAPVEHRMVKAAPLRARLAAFFRGGAPSRS